MTDRTRNEKAFSQDIAGFVFILLGGFAAVSIVLFLRGQAPNERVSAFTWPVVGLVDLLGSSAGLLLSGGLAALGSALFLRTGAFAPWRPLAALTAAALGFALILGAVESGGALGAWLPGLLAGFAGRALGAVLGLALAWLGWTLFFAARSERMSTAETVQRLGLSARHESAAGVSPAEAALLVTEPRTMPVRREEARPVRVETLRPFPPAPETPAAESRRKRAEGSAAPLTAAARPFTAPAAVPRTAPRTTDKLADDSAQATLSPAPPAPSWEQELADEPEPFGAEASELASDESDEADEAGETDERVEADDLETAEGLAAGLAAEFELEAALAETGAAQEDETDETDGADVEDEQSGASGSGAEPARSAGATPGASWEQVGLFDEAEDEDEEEPARDPAPAHPVKVELTPSFDFDSAEPERRVHEPEPVEDPFAAEQASVEAPHASPRATDPLELQPVRASAAAPRTAPPATPAPVAPDESEDAFAQLVFEAGCAILEQKRVAVSMLERRFQIDFDKACRVLDELQEAGLIGPYIGGRTRDILLTREEWLAHAPHAS